jgi:hypothetical protein
MEHSGQKTTYRSSALSAPLTAKLVVPDDVGFLRHFVGLLQNAC